MLTHLRLPCIPLLSSNLAGATLSVENDNSHRTRDKKINKNLAANTGSTRSAHMSVDSATTISDKRRGGRTARSDHASNAHAVALQGLAALSIDDDTTDGWSQLKADVPG